jgi:hypothetical protein
MPNYKVIKPFFKLSEQKNYAIGETIELSKEDALPLIEAGYLEDKSPKRLIAEVSKKDIEPILKLSKAK